jgi:hypothetical protein
MKVRTAVFKHTDLLQALPFVLRVFRHLVVLLNTLLGPC